MTSGIERILGMLGFARRSGRVIIGAEMVSQSLRKGGVEVVVVSSFASFATKERIKSKCAFYSVSLVEADIAMDKLGRILGKTTTPAVVAVTDKGLADEIIKASHALEEQ